MFQDEARFGLISEARRCWCPKPDRPVCASTVMQEYTYVYSAVSVLDGQMDSLILPRVNTACMQVFLDEVSSRYPSEHVIMVMDGAGWHKSTSLHVPETMRLIVLPPYSPELNPVENLWEEIREKYFHNRVFDSIESLEEQLMESLSAMEADIERVRSIVAWPWIINAIQN